MSHGSAAPSSSSGSAMPQQEIPDLQYENPKALQTDSTRSIRSTESGRADGKAYPYDCPSYNPMVVMAVEVEHILHQLMNYEEGVKDVRYYQVKNGKGNHYIEPWNTLDEKARAIVFFLGWKAIPSNRLSLSNDSFLNLLIECDVNPLFIDMLHCTTTGGAGSSITYSGKARDAFHLYIRYPRTYPQYECARYMSYSFARKQTVVISMEGYQTISSRAGHFFSQLLQDDKEEEPQNPFSYLVPFIVQMGRSMDELRERQTEEIVFIERSTDTGEIDLFQAGARDLSNVTHLTKLAHLRSGTMAKHMKLLKFHIRAVHEVIKAFKKFVMIDPDEPQEDFLTLRIERVRLKEILEQELDICVGRLTETENLVKRTDIQINVLMSLAAQKNSNINKRIAEQSKQIALETRRDSEAMKTIAILTVLFLPGTFVSSFLGMNFFDGEGGHFTSDSKWWIFLAASIPLTLLVVGSWSAWMLWKRRKADGEGYTGEIPAGEEPQRGLE